MSYVSIQAERTTVNYAQDINYIINASFNSLTEAPGSQIDIICFVPDTVDYHYHSPTYPITRITESSAPGGTHLIFSLIPLPESGISLAFDFDATFKLSTPIGTSLTVSATVSIPGRVPVVSTAQTVTLQAVSNYTVSQTTLVPSSTGGAAGDFFIYEILLENIGDQGAPLTQFTLTEVLPTSFSIDTTVPIIGTDISMNRFADPSSDGLTATLLGPTSFSFNISSYRGSKYRIRFKGYTAPTLEAGNEYITMATYSYISNRPIGPRTATDVFQIQLPTPAGSLTLYAPDYTKAGALFNAKASFTNSGNIALQDGMFHIFNVSSAANLSIRIHSFETGQLRIPQLNQILSIPYTLTIRTFKGITLSPISANTDTSSTILTDTLPLSAGDEILSIEYQFSEAIPIGAILDPPLSYNGLVDSTLTTTTYSNINATLKWTTLATGQNQVDNNFTTTIDQLSELAMTGSKLFPDENVKPGDTIIYQATIDCKYSPLTDPVLVLLLDPRLQYANFVEYLYTDFFGTDLSLIPRPTPRVIPNYGGGSNTIFMITYSGSDAYVFNQLATLTITIKFTVKQNATGTISQTMLLGTHSGDFTVAPGFDTFNATQPDGSIRALLTTPAFTSTLEVVMGLTSNFLVKGSLGSDYIQYPELSHTLAGEPISYNLSLTNQGDVPLHYVEIINILPHPQDTGIILTGTNRGSQFRLYPLSFAPPTLTPPVSSDPDPLFTISYSKSYDPVRFGIDGRTLIGTVNDWSTTPPTDMTQVAAYKLTLTQGIFRPSQTLSLISLAMSPPGTAPALVAWDSFTTLIQYIDEDGLVRTLLPIEPEMAGIVVDAPPPSTTSLGGLVFKDLDKDGLYQLSDPGVNDVAVVLYDGNGNLIQTVFTSPNSLGEAGHYIFSGLTPGYYSLRFLPNTSIYTLTLQVLNHPNGSMPSPQTGLTPLIPITAGVDNLNILTGVTPTTHMDTILAVNKSANKMVRNVLYNQMLLSMKLEDTTQFITF